jgi:hypothetical protein
LVGHRIRGVASQASRTQRRTVFLITLIDDDFLKIAVAENDTNYATLCFTGIGHALGGVDIQSEEFLRSSQNSTSIFIVDKRRSWGNNIDFSELKRIIEPYLRGKIVNALGNSMGAFLAILASKFIDIAVVVAIVPQYSVSKQIVPGESRWDKYVDEIKNWRYPSLEGSFQVNTQYYILAGVGGDDDKHLLLFPRCENIINIYFTEKQFVHSVAKILKSDGVLYEVIYECFSRHSLHEIMSNSLRKRKDILCIDL